MLKFAIAAVALVSASGALAAGSSPAEIVQRHVASGGNIDALMADYADDAVVLQNGRVLEGKAAIRKFYEGMFGGGRAAPASSGARGPAGAAPPAGGPPKMTVDKVWQEGNVGFVSWHMGPVKATEEFVIRNGKIDTQSVFMQGGPPASPRG
jgi:hypothetical protein